MTNSFKKKHLHLSLFEIPSSVVAGSTIVTIESFIPDLKQISADRDFDFVPIESPWLDRRSVHSDYAQVHNIHQLNIPHLTKYLSLNNLDYQFDEKFWKTLLSPWLFIITMNFLSKQKIVNQALRDHTFDSYSILQDPEKSLRYNNDEEYAANLRFNENWNFAQFSIILESMHELKPSTQSRCAAKVYEIKKTIKPHPLSNLAHSVSKFIAKYSHANIIFYGSYFDRLSLIRLQISLKKVPLIFSRFQQIENEHLVINRDQFTNIEAICSGNDPAFSKILKYTIPVYLLENFKSHIDIASNMRAQLKAKAIITATSLWFDTAFRFYVAYARYMTWNIPLMLIQHGGCVGLIKSDLVDIEQSFADYYLTWGFVGSEVTSNNVRFGNPKKTFRINRSPNDNDGRIVLVRSYGPRQVQMISAEVDSDQAYFQDSVSLVSCLNTEVKNNRLLLRLYPHQRAYNASIEIGNNEKRFWEREFRQVKIDDTTNIIKIYEKCALVIYTYIQGTGYLECLASNVPVIVLSRYFDKLVHPDFECISAELKRVKILFDDPVLAAQHVNNVYKDVNAWWFQEDVQKAVRNFNDVYCFRPSNRIGSFKETITSLINKHK